MRKNKWFKNAFTLTELLVVVIVLGVLAAVAVPKFSRVLETRRTTEAEQILSSLRTEQEYRCVLGKNYQTDLSAVESLASAKTSKNYSYSLTEVGANATSSKGYSIQMPSYKNGVLCCEGSYCSSLNKSYPSCSSLSVPEDECAGVMPAPPCVDCSCSAYANNHSCECKGICSCVEKPNQAKCCRSNETWNSSTQRCETNDCSSSSYAAAHPCECKNECSCTEKPNQAKCCASDETWNSSTQKCEFTNTCSNATYAKNHPCECAPNTCACSTYAAAYPCECAPNSCSCPTYAAAYPCECKGECAKSCDELSKPIAVQNCGNCGSQTRTVTCDTTTGQWKTGDWGTCSGQGECAAGSTETKSCGGIQYGGNQVRTCSSTCQWGTWKDNCYERTKVCTWCGKDCGASVMADEGGTISSSVSEGGSCSSEGEEVYKYVSGGSNDRVVYGPFVCQCRYE